MQSSQWDFKLSLTSLANTLNMEYFDLHSDSRDQSLLFSLKQEIEHQDNMTLILGGNQIQITTKVSFH